MFIIPDTILTTLKQLSLPKGPIVVGVSGGADSLYLSYILHQWCKQNRRKFLAVTVNHALRTEAQDEANWVHRQLLSKKINHTILTWEGAKPKTHIEERAREKRYELLLNFCHCNKAAALFLAHHQQDQTETFWARLARGSGLDGLCAMAHTNIRDNILIVRPLLNTTKDEIITTLQKHNIKWAEDPMNQDIHYERVRWRQMQPLLDKNGLTSTSITKSISRLQRAKQALEFYTQDFITKNLEKSPYGFVSMDEKIFSSQPHEIRVRACAHIISLFQKSKMPLPLESVEKIALTLPKYATLAGCQWVISHQKIFIGLESKKMHSFPLLNQKWTCWGNLLIWTNKPFIATAGAPQPRLKGIPFLIQRTFLKVPTGYQLHLLSTQKEVEKKSQMNYKGNKPIVIIQFNSKKEKP